MELSLILLPILAFVLLKGYLEQRAAARQDRVRLLEQALANPALDRTTIESLAYQLTGAQPPRQRGPSRLLAFLLALGWLALFSGLGIWLLGHLMNQDSATGAGVLVAVIGFGLVTYPFALRELESRQRT
jgi:hypothetical protein